MRRRRRGARVGLTALLVFAGCGGASLARTGASPRTVARTPAQAGTIDQKAVPLGDGYVATRPRVGYVDSCMTTFGGQGGAQAVGPWIDTAAKTWNRSAKIAVSGAVRWPHASYRETTGHGRRVLAFNDEPIGHTTGSFPIAASDPASAYDRNPNHIAAQSYAWRLPLAPRAARSPGCTPGGPIGVLRDGVLLYNALDGEGRDAAAHEVLDRCEGHPDQSSSYHHHDIPSCLLAKAPSGRATLVGYALDGYGIYVVKDRHGTMPGNTALDVCHGTTSRVRWNGRAQRVYHYVATLEYPYTVGCFHGTAIASGHAPSGPPPGAP
jgi:hypothetical protein